MADKAMDVYLNDHLAGATFGSDLARRIESQARGTPMATGAGELAAQIEEDLKTLLDLMKRMGVDRNPVKQATTWMAERLSRVKLSGLSSGEHTLGLFLSLETLSLGVEGKASLWRALKVVEDRYPALDSSELDALIVRAEAQRKTIESERAAAAKRVFAT